MQRFSKILFINAPPENAKSALIRTLNLARANEAELTIASFIEEFPLPLRKLQNAYTQIHQKDLQAQLRELSTAGVSITTRLLTGTPFLEIIKEVMQQGYDLVIKPSEGRGGVSNMLFGSTDLHLLRKCPCPLWIIKPSRTTKLSRILAAVDPDPAEAENKLLNKQILDLSVNLARRENSQLHILHAWAVPHEKTLRGGRARLTAEEVDRIVRETRLRHKQWLDGLVARQDLQGIGVKIHLLKGDACDIISNLAKRKKVELIVMGTVARTGIPGFFIGNTAEKTLAKVDCSVLALKPESFVTPVQEVSE